MRSELRKCLRARRRQLSPLEHRQRSKRAAASIQRLPGFKSGARVAIYIPFDSETSTDELLHAARRKRVRLYVPVVMSTAHHRMRFHALSAKTRAGRFGIHVPLKMSAPAAPRWLNLIVVPLVGVDGAGHRLGMGGGYYDRALAFRRIRRHWQGPRLVGIAFDCQKIDTTFPEAWDVRLDALATESGLELFPAPPPG